MLRRIRRPAIALLLALGALSLASCLSAEERDYVRYDAAKDEFHLLMVLSDIGAKDADDVEFLEAVYRNRDHLIAPALPGGANIFPLFAMNLIRMSDRQFAPVNLFTTRPSSLDATASVVPLDSITVTPGCFFLEGGKLGFYQACTLPGKTVDVALEEMAKAAQGEEMSKSIQAEFDRRAAGGKVFTWAELKAKALKEMTLEEKKEEAAATAPAEGAATQETVEVSPEKVLEEQSLKNLLEAAKGQKLGVKRDRTALVLTVPLTAKDSAAAVDVVKAALARATELAATPQNAENAEKLLPFKVAQQLGGVAKITAGGDAGVTLSVDVLEFTKATTGLPAQRIDMNDKKEGEGAKPLDVAAALKAKGVPLDETQTAEGVVKAFNAGTLKGNPSAMPVKPGEGLVKTPAP